MRTLRTLRLRLESLLRRRRVEADLQEELQTHLQREIERLRHAGKAAVEARTIALREFGNVALIEEQCRDMRRLQFLDDARRDLGYALRSMRRTPAWTAIVLMFLALAIGANTSMFTLVNAVMIRELPIARPDGLVEVSRMAGRVAGSFSYPLYARLRDETRTFSGLIAMSTSSLAGGAADRETPLHGRYVSGNFFDVLGLQPGSGRLLSPSDDRLDGSTDANVVVIADSLWRREYAASADAVGRTLLVDGVAFTIVGVLPRGFRGIVAGRPDDFFIPMAAEPRLRRRSWLGGRDSNWLTVAGRLSEGISPAAAAVDASVVFGRFIEDWASSISDDSARRRVRSHRIVIEPAWAGVSAPRREFGTPVLLLMGAVGLVLLIACANVVNLLLARGLARRREIGLRLAIGASPGRVIRQLLTEAIALGLFGGAAGLAVAMWTTPILARLMANGDPAVDFDVAPDGHVLLFTAGTSLAAAIVAGVSPARRAVRDGTIPGLRDSRTATAGRATVMLTRLMVTGQVALSVVLLAGAALLVTSLRNLQSFDAGFDREHVVLFALDPARAGLTGEARVSYYRRVLDRVRGVPGVRAAGLALITPISGGGMDLPLAVEGRPSAATASVYVNDISEGFFASMATPVLSGREFTPSDRPGGVAVAVVNEALARRAFTDGRVLGRRVTLAGGAGLEIVGVVANAKYLSLREEDQPTIYTNVLQRPADASALTLVVNTASDPAGLRGVIRREAQSVAATAPVAAGVMLAAQVDRSLITERLVTRMLTGFAALALVLAAVGLYGVLGYAVSRRAAEIAIRRALGAGPTAVLWSVLRELWVSVATGAAVGVAAAITVTRSVAALLYGVTPTDLSALTAAVLSLFGVALIAAAQPAWRALRVDPLVSLRLE